MFTTHIPRTGNTRSTTGKKALTFTALATVAGLGAGMALAAPMAATAAEAPHSYAEGQFLSGSLAGLDLAQVVELASAEARNNGTQSTQVSRDPLTAAVLQAIKVDVPGGVQLGLGDFLDLGAASQFAQAASNGSSLGASGAVSNDGGIGVGATDATGMGNTTLNLGALLGGQFASSISDLKLELGAVSAQAAADLQTASGDYNLAGAKLNFTSPAIAGLTSKVTAALGPVDQAIADLSGSNGILGTSLNDVLNPILGTLGSSANVSVTITTDVHEAVQSLLTSAYGNGAVSFNLETGAVSVDLEKLLGGDLNNLPVNTEILSDTVINQVLKGITDTVSTLADQIVAKVEASLNNARLDVDADLNVLTPQDGGSTQQCTEVPIVGDVLGGVGGLLGGLLGGTVGQTTQTVCTLIPNLLPDLQTTLAVDVHGTVKQILNGTADQSAATLTLLGIPVTVDVNNILNGLVSGLTDSLFDSDGAVKQLVASLNSGLVNPAVTGLLGGGSSVSTVLTDILSVRVNLQETQVVSGAGFAVANGSLFTETAVRVRMLNGVGGSGLATVNLAAATVGPNVTTVVDPGCTVNCGPTDPGCTVNCGPGNPGDPGTPITTAGDRLATTGVGIATLIAVILALLAAGAYMAREGYRKNHPQPLT